MPSKTGQLKHELLVSSADFEAGLRRNSRHRSSSKASKDMALVPPQANQTALKFRDSKDESQFHPPLVHQTNEFWKSRHDDGQIGKNQQDQTGRNGVYIDGELIRHMSSLPGYLQRGDNPAQDKVLSFGVLDWDRLEKWKHKQNRVSSHSGASTSASSLSVPLPASSCARTSSECSKKDSSSLPNKVKTTQGLSSSRKKQPADSGDPASRTVEPSRRVSAAHNEKELSSTRDSSKHQRSRLDKQPPSRFVKDKPSSGGSDSDVNSSKKKTSSNSYVMRESLQMEGLSSSSKMARNVAPFIMEEKLDALFDKPDDIANGLRGNNPIHGHHHSKQESIVLLLPKDFSKSEFLDGGSQRASSNENSAELNSFSDVFSIEEFHLEEPVPDILRSSSPPFMAKTETDLDSNLDNLIHAQRMPFLSDQPSLSDDPSKHRDSPQDEAKVKHNDSAESRGSTATLETFRRKSSETKSSNTTMDNSSAPRQFSFDMGKITRSFSFKESSAAAVPRLSYTSIKSAPATKAPPVVAHHSSTGNGNSLVPTPGRARSSPLRRLLDPLLKPRGASSKNSGKVEELKNLSFKTIVTAGGEENEHSKKSGSSSTMVKAVLYLTVNNGVPVFKFLVESRNEILSCSVKRLNPIRSDDPSWLYSFSSVSKTKRKSSSSWKYQGSKGRGGSELSCTVIGQLKVHEPLFPATELGDGDIKDKSTVTTEAVLYGVDLSKVDTADTEYMTNKELGAIIIQNSACISKDEGRRTDGFVAASVAGHIVVILPGGVHSLPNEGGPSSLISRWRSGGECDCGGWDVGCKLQILSDDNAREDDSKISRYSRGYYTDQHDCCSLFLQGASSGKQNDQPVFRLTANGDGAVYSIEYHDAISSLQAFAIAVAVLGRRDEPNDVLNYTYRPHNEMPKVHVRSKSAIFLGEGAAKFATNPPHSPVGRA